MLSGCPAVRLFCGRMDPWTRGPMELWKFVDSSYLHRQRRLPWPCHNHRLFDCRDDESSLLLERLTPTTVRTELVEGRDRTSERLNSGCIRQVIR